MPMKLGHLEPVRARLLICINEPILVASNSRRTKFGMYAGLSRWYATRLLAQPHVHEAVYQRGFLPVLSRCIIASVVFIYYRAAIRLIAVPIAVGVYATKSGLSARSRVRLCA